MAGDSKQYVLITLYQDDIDLPEDGLTVEKIRTRAFAFQFKPENSLSFHIERHPSMYLSDIGVPGIEASPPRC